MQEEEELKVKTGNNILLKAIIVTLALLLLSIFTLHAGNGSPCKLDNEIPVNSGCPPGGVSYITWEFKDNFVRLDIDIDIIQFDASKYFYLQFYQCVIGDDIFYFGIQNRADENDQMLIFSRWGTRDLAYVEANVAEGGFCQSDGYEGDFVGVRLPNFKLRNGEYTFSLIRDKEDDEGTWYKYIVTEKSTNTKTWCGSIRFDKGAKISRVGSTWTELYGKPWPVQTYRHLPHWDIKVKSIKGDNRFPIHATSFYTDPRWGDHIPMEDISYNSSENSIRIRLGPDVVRKNTARYLF